MKNKIAIASAFIAASSFSTAEIVVNDFLSFEGFVDMSYSHSEIDSDRNGLDGSDNSFAIDQVEISWLFDFDVVTAQIDLQYEDLPGDSTAVEQAFATYHFDNGAAITAGRYASMLGFEAFEPTGLYQYSFAYTSGVYDAAFMPGYAQGVKVTYETDNTFFGFSVQDSISDRNDDSLGGSDASSWGLEVAGSISFDNGIAWFAGAGWEDGDNASGDSNDTYVLNTYVTYETGAWLFAAELAYGEAEDGRVAGILDPSYVGPEPEVLNALLMANYAYSDVASVTGRLSYAEVEDDNGNEVEFLKYTIAHGYSFTDNLMLVTELSYTDLEEDNGADSDELAAAVELLFSF
jgi:hypothetical protein